MRIQYRTTVSDVLSLNWISLTKSIGQLAFTVAMSFILAWSLRPNNIFLHGYAVGVTRIIIATGAAFMVFCLVGLAVPSILSLSRRNKTFMTEHTLELHEDKFLAENRYCKTEYKWDIVQRVVRTRRHLVIFVSKNAGIVVPRRVFQDKSDWDSFYSFVKKHSTK